MHPLPWNVLEIKGYRDNLNRVLGPGLGELYSLLEIMTSSSDLSSSIGNILKILERNAKLQLKIFIFWWRDAEICTRL